jgi:hypothetical protein
MKGLQPAISVIYGDLNLDKFQDSILEMWCESMHTIHDARHYKPVKLIVQVLGLLDGEPELLRREETTVLLPGTVSERQWSEFEEAVEDKYMESELLDEFHEEYDSSLTYFCWNDHHELMYWSFTDGCPPDEIPLDIYMYKDEDEDEDEVSQGQTPPMFLKLTIRNMMDSTSTSKPVVIKKSDQVQVLKNRIAFVFDISAIYARDIQLFATNGDIIENIAGLEEGQTVNFKLGIQGGASKRRRAASPAEEGSKASSSASERIEERKAKLQLQIENFMRATKAGEGEMQFDCADLIKRVKTDIKALLDTKGEDSRSTFTTHIKKLPKNQVITAISRSTVTRNSGRLTYLSEELISQNAHELKSIIEKLSGIQHALEASIEYTILDGWGSDFTKLLDHLSKVAQIEQQEVKQQRRGWFFS